MAEPLELRLHPDAAELVPLRAKVLAALRRHLDGQGLVEADVGALAPFAGQEPMLRPPTADVPGLPGPLYLQTSPELLLKRLVWAGTPAVYALGPAYRGGFEELSTRHQPEFLMLEWYRPGDATDLLVDDVVGLVRAAAEALGVPAPAGTGPDDRDVRALEEAFPSLTGCSLDEATAGADGAGRFHRLLVERVEPALLAAGGRGFLRDYPACASALARVEADEDGRPTARRVEAYLDGVELANGWVELTDADELAARWEAERAERDTEAPVLDARLIDLYRRRPPPQTVGMALGVDRLVMALQGRDRLGDVRPLRLARPGEAPDGEPAGAASGPADGA